MAKITNEMVEASYDVGKKFYNKKITLKKGTKTLSQLGMNRNSAVDYIYFFTNLIEGKLYTRTSNVYATDYYLNNIYNEKGYGSLENCLLSLLQHIEYYEDKTGTTLNQQRLIYKKYSDFRKTQKKKSTVKYYLPRPKLLKRSRTKVQYSRPCCSLLLLLLHSTVK